MSSFDVFAKVVFNDGREVLVSERDVLNAQDDERCTIAWPSDLKEIVWGTISDKSTPPGVFELREVWTRHEGRDDGGELLDSNDTEELLAGSKNQAAYYVATYVPADAEYERPEWPSID